MPVDNAHPHGQPPIVPPPEPEHHKPEHHKVEEPAPVHKAEPKPHPEPIRHAKKK